MPRLASSLANLLGRTVVDRTMMMGHFDLQLEWSPEAPVGAAPADGPGASIFTAVQEQLGLRLDAARGPVNVLVLERVQRPIED
jgi:uncharacterized protein (TIGR03435 family)